MWAIASVKVTDNMDLLWIILMLAALGWALHLRGRLTAAEAELQRCCAEQGEQSERQLLQQHALLDSMVEGVLVLDSENRIELTNASLRQLLGLADEVNGQSLEEAVPAAVRAELKELVTAVREAGELRAGELQLNGGDPKRVHINAHCLQRGAGQHTLLVFHNVTRLKELENTRRDFVANVSHELRTPLSLIKGFTETLMDGAVDDPKKSREFLQTIDKHADRLGYLIDDLLTLAQLDSGRLAMNRQPTNLRALAERVEEDLSTKAAKRSIELKTDIPADLLLDADGDRLQQAVFNLVDNAIKYGRTGGTVTIEGRASAQGMAEVAVADDGEGIPAEAVEQVFERFFRVDKARSRETGGTGLGLAIVKHIVHSHGGKVRLESKIGCGARFILSLPMAAEKEVAA